jgi:hypothetical protein
VTRSDFVRELLDAARLSIGTTETTRNSGPEIDAWLKYAHSRPGMPWCAAWVVFMHRIAAVSLDVLNPCPRTAGSLHLWSLAPDEVKTDLPAPGDTFVLDTGAPGGAGHCGIVETVSPSGDAIVSIEGNTGKDGEREGTTVWRHQWQPRTGKRGRLVGFLSFANLVVERPFTPPAGLPPSPFK